MTTDATTTYLPLIRETLDRLSRSDQYEPGSEPDRAVFAAVTTIDTAWSAVAAALRQAAIDVDAARGQPRSDGGALPAAPFARQVTIARAAIDPAITTARTALDTLRTSLGQLAGIDRPPLDATSMAWLADRHQTWRGVLDAIPQNLVVHRLLELLDAASDPVEAWALAADDWPTMYVESRGVNPRLWTTPRDAHLAPHRSDTAARAVAHTDALLGTGPDSLRTVVLAIERYAAAQCHRLERGNPITLPVNIVGVAVAR